MKTNDIVSQNDQLERYLSAHPHSVIMDIGQCESRFSFWQESALTQVVLPIGTEMIAKRHFPHTPPTYDDIEYAINDIEDEIEKVAALIPLEGNGYQFISFNSYLRQLALACFVKEADIMVLPRTSLERLFGEYAEIVTGRPPRSYEPDVSPLFYSQLLIFREYFHHLKFTQVTLVNSLSSLITK